MTEYFTGNYKKCIAEQPIRVSDAILPDPSPRDSRTFAYAALVGIGIIFGIFVITGLKACDKRTETSKATQDCTGCHRKMALTEYFRKSGSKSPEELAHGVLQTRSPRLLAAIAVVESNGNTRVRNTGYKRRHDGAFQVNPRYHRRVPNDAVGQALQAERILEELVGEKKSIKVALNSYGGDSTDKYSRKILKELERVP